MLLHTQWQVMHVERNIIDATETNVLEKSGFPDTVSLRQLEHALPSPNALPPPTLNTTATTTATTITTNATTTTTTAAAAAAAVAAPVNVCSNTVSTGTGACDLFQTGLHVKRTTPLADFYVVAMCSRQRAQAQGETASLELPRLGAEDWS